MASGNHQSDDLSGEVAAALAWRGVSGGISGIGGGREGIGIRRRRQWRGVSASEEKSASAKNSSGALA